MAFNLLVRRSPCGRVHSPARILFEILIQLEFLFRKRVEVVLRLIEGVAHGLQDVTDAGRRIFSCDGVHQVDGFIISGVFLGFVGLKILYLLPEALLEPV